MDRKTKARAATSEAIIGPGSALVGQTARDFGLHSRYGVNLLALVMWAALILLPEIALTHQFMDRFEARFGWAVKNSDWSTPQFLDAAEAAPGLARLVLLYDPRVPEDRLHADRLGVHIHVIAADGSPVRNLDLCVRSAHLEVKSIIAAPVADDRSLC